MNPERTREKCHVLMGAQAQLWRVEGRGTLGWGSSKAAKRMCSDLGVKRRNPAKQVGGLCSLSRRVYAKVAGEVTGYRGEPKENILSFSEK